MLKEKHELEICYIHKVAFVPRETEEPIPFAGIQKFIDYVCPVCEQALKEKN
tara:strand:+ start:330 stop:485 length:156 start_codon:yes stop_codon:yes gene_type:complete